MSTINTLSTINPYGETDGVLDLLIDIESDAYKLSNVIKRADTYTFSIWYKSEQESSITFNLFGSSETVVSSNEWVKYIKTITVSDLNDPNIYIISALNTHVYLYEGYLAKGVVDNSWLPAPEDIYSEIALVESSFEQRADSIEMSVRRKVIPTSFRYLRDWLNGSTVDTANHWVNCIITQHTISGDINIALDKTVEAFDQNGNSIEIENSSAFTNGELLVYPGDIDVAAIAEDELPLASSYATTTSGKYYLQIDLGAVYTDIALLKVWHYYHDNRKYNNKIEVSSDGENWFTIYDSDINGIYSEIEDGKLYLLDETNIYSSLSELKVGLDSMSGTVQGLESQAGFWLTEDSFNLGIGANIQNQINNLPNAEDIENAKQEAISKAEERTQLLIQASENAMTTAFRNEFGDTLSQIQQTTDDWTATFRRKFAEIGMDEYEDVYTNFIVSSEGAEVTSVDENNIKFGTKMKLDGFEGYYGEEVVFKIDKDKVYTYRVYNRGGIDFAPVDATANELTANGGVKYVPKVYYDNNHNKRYVLCHVKSGGSS